MPYGRTVTIWVICDKCGDCISDDAESGSKRDAIVTARMNGWSVYKDGTCLCDKCRCRRYTTKVD